MGIHTNLRSLFVLFLANPTVIDSQARIHKINATPVGIVNLRRTDRLSTICPHNMFKADARASVLIVPLPKESNQQEILSAQLELSFELNRKPAIYQPIVVTPLTTSAATT